MMFEKMRSSVNMLPSLGLALGLAACSDDGAEDILTPDTVAVEALPMDTLDLQASGLVVPPQNGFEQLDVPFGSLRAATETTLANVVGEIQERGETGECGLATARYEGLTLNFREGEFVGYLAEEPYVPWTPRAELLTDPQVTLLEESTLGEEFVIGDPQGRTISGLFDGSGDDASVQALWAGENCIAR